jgi:hypothetical protein
MRRVQAGKGRGSPEAHDSPSRYELRRAATLTGYAATAVFSTNCARLAFK